MLEVEKDAYRVATLHCLKNLTSSVFGVLLGDKPEEGGFPKVREAIPLFHCRPTVPMLDVAFDTVDQSKPVEKYAERNGGLLVVGFYESALSEFELESTCSLLVTRLFDQGIISKEINEPLFLSLENEDKNDNAEIIPHFYVRKPNKGLSEVPEDKIKSKFTLDIIKEDLTARKFRKINDFEDFLEQPSSFNFLKQNI